MDGVIFLLLGAAAVLLLGWARSRYAGFLAQAPADYQAQPSAFDLPRVLNGKMICEGVIYGPTGRVASRFVADFDVSWDGPEGVMLETFRYDDGSVQDRSWQLTLGQNGHFSARASDVVGVGNGVMAGDAVQLKYKFKLPEGSGGHVLDTVDWMYLAPNGTVMNRSQFRKFGIKVAELVAVIRPAEPVQLKDAA